MWEPSLIFFFFSSRRRHTRCGRDWSSDVCSSDLRVPLAEIAMLSLAREGFAGLIEVTTRGRANLFCIGTGLGHDLPSMTWVLHWLRRKLATAATRSGARSAGTS